MLGSDVGTTLGKCRCLEHGAHLRSRLLTHRTREHSCRVGLAERAIDVAENNVRAERASFLVARTTNFQVMQRQGELIDIPSSSIRVDGLPEPPPGMRIAHIDVVVRLVKA